MAQDLIIPSVATDFSDFVQTFEQYLVQKPTWKGNLTTQSSQTLIELVSAVGTFMEGRNIRTAEDAFSETAQSDDSIRAITQMQGLRMTRKLPAAVPTNLTSTVDVTINPMTQFMISGQYYFNRQQLFFAAGVPQNITLYQGKITAFAMNGLGSPRQTFLSDEDDFFVSDQDVRVYINGTLIERSLGTLWNYRDLPAYADLTTSDGRLLVVFGNEQFGYTPIQTDVVAIQYAITQGADGGNMAMIGKPVTVDGHTEITGKAIGNPSGGGDEQPIQTYKNLSAGAFGTYSSAVTKSQYLATVGVYPGIIDSVTQAQRDIDPMNLEWMNVMRISALTTSPWTHAQQQDYIKYLQSVTMYAVRFVWQDPIPVYRDVDVICYCFNTAILSKVEADVTAAITALFAPRPGLLMTNFYNSDLDSTCKNAGAGAISYVVINKPLDPMIVTAPPSPALDYAIVPGSGTLTPLVYAYGVSVVNLDGEEGPPANWVFPQITQAMGPSGVDLSWVGLQNVQNYKVYGRTASGVGLLATVGPLTTSWHDDGSITPGAPPPGTANIPIRYNALGSLKVKAVFAERQLRFADNPTRMA